MNQSINLIEQLKERPEPRVEPSKLHNLSDIMFIALCAVLSGADRFEEMAEYGRRGIPAPVSCAAQRHPLP